MLTQPERSSAIKTVSYDRYGVMIGRLCELLAGKEFTKVYGPPRGGLPLAVHISHCFDLPMILSEDDLYNMNNWLPQDRLLLVDDIIDTGHTLENISLRLDLRHISHITAVLFKKVNSTFLPDIFLETCETWVVFPWERAGRPPAG